jgi:hypothetical protein
MHAVTRSVAFAGKLLLCSLMLPPTYLHEELICTRFDACARICTCSPCQFHHLVQGRCVPSCPENTVGLLLYRLIITNALIINACDLGRGLILRHFTEQAYDPPDVGSAPPAVCTSRRDGADSI